MRRFFFALFILVSASLEALSLSQVKQHIGDALVVTSLYAEDTVYYLTTSITKNGKTVTFNSFDLYNSIESVRSQLGVPSYLLKKHLDKAIRKLLVKYEKRNNYRGHKPGLEMVLRNRKSIQRRKANYFQR